MVQFDLRFQNEVDVFVWVQWIDVHDVSAKLDERVVVRTFYEIIIGSFFGVVLVYLVEPLEHHECVDHPFLISL